MICHYTYIMLTFLHSTEPAFNCDTAMHWDKSQAITHQSLPHPQPNICDKHYLKWQAIQIAIN